MDQTYHKIISELEQREVDADYINGWVGGYLHNPKREEQRITERYEIGYADGCAGQIDNA